MIRRAVKCFCIFCFVFVLGCGGLRQRSQRKAGRMLRERESASEIDMKEDHFEIGKRLFYRGDIKGAVKEFEIAVKESPSTPQIHYNIGLVYYKLGNIRESIEKYKSALELKPDLAEAYFNLGVAYDQLDQLEESLDAYNMALRHGLDEAALHFNRGVVLLKLCRFEEAEAANLNALKINPDLPEVYNNLGYVAEAGSDINKAIEMYKRSLSIKPNYKIAQENLSRLLKEPKPTRPAKIEKGLLSRLNFELDGKWAFEKDIELDAPGGSAEVGSESKSFILRSSFDVTRWLDLFIDLGIQDLSFDQPLVFARVIKLNETFGKDIRYLGYEKVEGPVWGLGLNADIFRIKRLNLGFDTGFEFLMGFNDDKAKGGSEDYEASSEWKEYILSLRTKYLGFRSFVPYTGILLDKLDGSFSIEGEERKTELDYEESNIFGVLLGGSYYRGENLRFQTEARLLNEISLALRMKYSF